MTKEERQLYNKKYRQNNKDKLSEKQKKYYKRPEVAAKRLIYMQEYGIEYRAKAENKEYIKEYRKKYGQDNKEKLADKQREHHAKPEVAARRRAYYQEYHRKKGD